MSKQSKSLTHELVLKNINRTLTATVPIKLTDGYYADNALLNIGCHAACLSNIYLEASVSKIESRNPNRFGKQADWDELAEIQKEIARYELPKDERIRLFNEIIRRVYKGRGNSYEGSKEQPLGYTFVFMSDTVNSYSEAFPKNSGIHKEYCVPRFKTADFVDYLRENNIGVVVGSPISRNQYHQSYANFSLTQAFIWIPPNFAGVAAPNSWFISGLEQLPSLPKWIETTCKKASVNSVKSLWQDGIPRTTGD